MKFQFDSGEWSDTELSNFQISAASLCMLAMWCTLTEMFPIQHPH